MQLVQNIVGLFHAAALLSINFVFTTAKWFGELMSAICWPDLDGNREKIDKNSLSI